MSDKKDKEFRELQDKWYKKLAKEGFDDLEWTDSKTGRGQNSRYLKKTLNNLRKVYDKNRATHYRLCENFLTHGRFPSKKHEFIFKLYVNGISYRLMIPKMFNNFKTGKRSFSVFYIHPRLHECLKLMRQFTLSDPEGMQSDPEYLSHEDEVIAYIDARNREETE